LSAAKATPTAGAVELPTTKTPDPSMAQAPSTTPEKRLELKTAVVTAPTMLTRNTARGAE
jgi:hypothetical protein